MSRYSYTVFAVIVVCDFIVVGCNIRRVVCLNIHIVQCYVYCLILQVFLLVLVVRDDVSFGVSRVKFLIWSQKFAL